MNENAQNILDGDNDDDDGDDNIETGSRTMQSIITSIVSKPYNNLNCLYSISLRHFFRTNQIIYSYDNVMSMSLEHKYSLLYRDIKPHRVELINNPFYYGVIRIDELYYIRKMIINKM